MSLVFISTRRRILTVRVISVPHHRGSLAWVSLVHLEEIAAEFLRHLNRRLDVVRLYESPTLLVLLTLRLGERDSNLES